MLELALCKRLYDVLVDPAHGQRFKIIQIVPELQEFEDKVPIVAHESSRDTLDIGMTKRTYLALFKEAHAYWHANLAPNLAINLGSENYLQSLDMKGLWEVYYASLGYLITTHEHSTMVRMHERVLSAILERVSKRKESLLVFEEESLSVSEDESLSIQLRDLEVLTCFVNSRLKRINKSSQLWHSVKKSTVRVVMSDLEHRSCEYRTLVDRTMKSIDLHFANYYASSFLRWLIRTNYILQGQCEPSTQQHQTLVEVDNRILDRVIEKARAKLTDCSVWSCLETYLTLHLGADLASTEAYVMEEYASLSGKPLLKPQGIKPWKQADAILDTVENLLAWLIKIECVVFTPFKSCVTPLILMDDYNKAQTLLGRVQTYHEHAETDLSNMTSENPDYYRKRAFFASMKRLFDESASTPSN